MSPTAEAGTAYVPIRGDLSGLQKQLGAAFAPAKMGKLGKAAGVGLVGGLVAAGTTKVLADIGAEFDKASNTIRRGTGATGKELDSLNTSFKNILKDVPADFETASKAVADLNTRLGLTGKPLERMGKQIAELSRMTDTDIAANVKGISRAFVDWEVPVRKQTRTLDGFWRVSQQSGASVEELTSSVQKFGSPLRQLGFSLDEAAAMFATFERAGVNSQTMVPGFKLAIGNLTDPTDDFRASMEELDIAVGKPDKALRQVFELLGEGSNLSKVDRIGLAFDTFGKRAGSDMKEAIEQGRFEFDDMVKTMRKGDETIRKAGRETMELGDHWQVFTNRLKIAVEPAATAVFQALADGMKWLNNFSLSDLIDDLRESGWAFRWLESIVGRVIPGIVALLRGFARMIKGIVQVISGILTGDFEKAWDGVKNIFGGYLQAIGGIMRAWTAPFREIAARLGNAISGPLGDALDWVRNAVRNVGRFLSNRWQDIAQFTKRQWEQSIAKRIIDALDDAFSWVRDAVRSIGRFLSRNWQDYRDTTGRIWDQTAGRVTGAVETMRDAFKWLVEKLRRLIKVVTRAGEAIAGPFVEAGRAIARVFERIVDAVNNALEALDAIKDKVPSLPGINIPKPNIPTPSIPLFRQRGGPINQGKASGDSVPALLERDEYVLNRKAVKKVGRRTLDAINFGMAPRFQHGGAVGMQTGGGFPELVGGARALAQQLAKRGFIPTSTYRPTSNTYHGRRMAIDYGDSINDQQKLWSILRPNPGRFAELFGPTRTRPGPHLWKFGNPFSDAGLQAGHQDHIHVAVAGALSGALGAGMAMGPLIKKITSGWPGQFGATADSSIELVRQAANQYYQDKMPVFGHDMVASSGVGGPWQSALRQIAQQRGWNAAHWMELVMRESSGNPRAVNPSSGAAGLAQALPASKYPPGAWPYTGPQSAVKQIEWMASYMAGRYGSPTAALAFHDRNNWYQRGGLVQLLQEGGLVGDFDEVIGNINKAVTGEGAAGRSKVIGRLLGLVGQRAKLNKFLRTLRRPKTALPQLKELQEFGAAEGLLERSNQASEFADRAGDVGGKIAGHDEIGWVRELLNRLLAARNAAIERIAEIQRQREQFEAAVAKMVERLRKQLAPRIKAAKALVDQAAGPTRKRLRKRVRELEKVKPKDRSKQHKEQLRQAKGRLEAFSAGGDIMGALRQRWETLRDHDRDLIAPPPSHVLAQSETGRIWAYRDDTLSSVFDSALEDFSQTLEQIQGPAQTATMAKLRRLPPVGQLGGEILQAQLRLRDFGEDERPTVDNSEQLRLTQELLRQSQQRLRISEAQFPVFQDFAGMFARGGVIPRGMWGIAGETGQPEVVAGPARVFSPAESAAMASERPVEVNISFAEGMEWLAQFVEVSVDDKLEKVARGSKGLTPGRKAVVR